MFSQTKQILRVEQAVNKLTAAMLSANQKELEDITSKHLSYGHSNGRVENCTSFIENLVQKKSVFLTITITDQKIEVFKKSAIVRHSLAATTNDNGVAGSVQLKVLLVFVKQKSNWVLFARQSIKN
ncbi:MAG: nuclear transport factor 2 family protein [Sediminibacterium sp.]|nr:nuclear transport factor 2 family protein [Sediminibacterium sp.]